MGTLVPKKNRGATQNFRVDIDDFCLHGFVLLAKITNIQKVE
jgi:hypothetical protein